MTAAVTSIAAATRAGAAHVWSQQAKLVNRDPQPIDHVGFNAAISADGQTALAGTPAHAGFRGAAYVFVHHPSGWVQQAKLKANDLTPHDFRIDFGWAVALSDDGNTAVVGAPDKDLLTGAVYVFTRSGYKWSQTAEFQADDATQFAEFGQAVAVSHDGRTIVVGAPSDRKDAGAVYVFVRGESGYVQKAKLTVDTPPGLTWFGFSVAMGRDGSDIIAGAPLQNSFKGGAYIFSRSGAGWVQTAALPRHRGDGEFGHSVDISHDGDVAIVGSPEGQGFAGAAYIYRLGAAGWRQSETISPPATSAAGDFFGFSAALGHDAETAVIGAPDYKGFIGAAYVYSLISNAWVQTAVLTATDGVPGDNLGFSVAMARDANTVAVGADNADFSATPDTGALCIFRRS